MKVIQLKSTKSLFFLCLLVFSAFASNISSEKANVSAGDVFFNTPGTGDDSPHRSGWLGYWQLRVQEQINGVPILCYNRACNFTATQGAHVSLLYDDGVYIIPLCANCNHSTNTGPMSVKLDTGILKLTNY